MQDPSISFVRFMGRSVTVPHSKLWLPATTSFLQLQGHKCLEGSCQGLAQPPAAEDAETSAASCVRPDGKGQGCKGVPTVAKGPRAKQASLTPEGPRCGCPSLRGSLSPSSSSQTLLVSEQQETSTWSQVYERSLRQVRKGLTHSSQPVQSSVTKRDKGSIDMCISPRTL